MRNLTKLSAAVSMLALTSVAQADLNRVGPANVPSPPGHGFPAWYQDLNGLTLDFCLPDANDPGQLQQTACLLVGAGLPNPPYVFPTNFPDEVFFFRAVSDVLDTSPVQGAATHKAVLVLALEGAFASGGAQAGQQMVFTRIRVTAGVPHPGTWTVTHPYGIETFVVDVATGARDIFFSEDIGITAGNFTDALSSRVGPFLQATNADGTVKAPVVLNGASFLSDGVALETLTGSPFGTNWFEMCGPYDGVNTTCRSTPLFTLTGRVHNGTIPSPLRVDRATYSRSTAGAQVDVSANARAGIGQAAPQLTAAAATVPPVILAGPTGLGEYYAQGIPVPPTAIPSVLTVINSSDVPPTSATAHVTDAVTITSATYGSGTLTVIATSSDKGDATSGPPSLALDGFPSATATAGAGSDPAETIFTVSGLTVPPPSVRVSSTVGGQGHADVVMSLGAPFAPGVPLAVDDNATATAGGLPVTIGVIDNDIQSSLALAAPPVALVTLPTLGTAVANADGTVTYTPSNLSGSDAFSYTVSNVAGKSNVASVSVVVGPSLNPAPVAVNDPSTGTLSVGAGNSLVINVLANDSANGGTLDGASILITQGAGGTAVANANGSVTYTAGNTAGTFTFSYTVANTNGQRSNAASVTVSVTPSETITLKGAQCQRQGTQWVVQGSSNVLTGTMTIFNTGLVPAAPVVSQIIANVPISAGKWQYNVKGGPACVTPISLKSTGGGKLENVQVAIK